MELKYIFLAEGYIAQHLTQMLHHLYKSHEREFSYVFDTGASHRSHSVASPETNLAMRIILEDRLHEV